MAKARSKKPIAPARKQTKATKQHRAATALPITPIEYGGLQEAYDHFNKELFDGQLPDCFITLQRKANSMGYFAADRFSGRIAKYAKHELALNPDAFINQTDMQVGQTLAHEMAHVWRHPLGTPPSRGYHDKIWSAKMKDIGLQPSSTGMVGGKETGQRMSDYIIPGGRFELAFKKLAATGWKLNLQSAPRPGQRGRQNSGKTPFRCSCGETGWGKPSLGILCENCSVQFLTDAGVEKGALTALLNAAKMSADVVQA